MNDYMIGSFFPALPLTLAAKNMVKSSIRNTLGKCRARLSSSPCVERGGWFMQIHYGNCSEHIHRSIFTFYPNITTIQL
jgi:hypothetical protein